MENIELIKRQQHALQEEITFLAQSFENDERTYLKETVQSMKIILDRYNDYLENLCHRITEKNKIQESRKVHTLTSAVDQLVKDKQGKFFRASVTVLLENQEFLSDDCTSKVEATQSVYRKLAHQFGLNASDDETNVKSLVLDYFIKCGVPKISEALVQQDKVYCKLQLSGSFIFQSRCGSTKKKAAEQQAAKVALQHLAGFLNCGSVDDLEGNYKGCLKEHLEALGLKSPVYDFKFKRSPKDAESLFRSKDGTQSKNFYGSVVVLLEKQEVHSDGFDQEEEATESAYRKLAGQLGLTFLDKGKNVKTEILSHFLKCNFPAPEEKIICKLHLSWIFKFYDQVGAKKKKQAEQQAARVALKYLAGLLNCDFSNADGKNYKGHLKESLGRRGLKGPEYHWESDKGITGKSVELSTYE